MSKDEIKVLVIDPIMGPYVRVMKNDIHSFYNVIDCDCIDIATRKIGDNGKYYDIIVDDEGLLKSSPLVSAFNKDLKPMLVGNLIITKYNEDGETTTLTEEDITYLKQHIGRYTKFLGKPIPYYCLLNVSY